MEKRIVSALASVPLDYEQQKRFICKEESHGARWNEASVLVLLSPGFGDSEKEEHWHFILNKRSQNVPQPGDLCWPGGHPKEYADRFFGRWVIPYFLPTKKSSGFAFARKRGKQTFSILSFFLAGALRETWEEMRLNPASVRFLGALPCYRMVTRNKLIYPMVGVLRKNVPFSTGQEIEKNIRVCVNSVLSPENYGTYRLELTGKFQALWGSRHITMPCYVVKRPGRPDEILWGASYNILMDFLKIVFDFTPPKDGPMHTEGVLYPSEA